MFFYILKRILATIPVMVIVAIFVFLLLRLTPGDPAAILAGDAATPAQLERIRDSLGLNDPLLVQFGTWMGQLFGTSPPRRSRRRFVAFSSGSVTHWTTYL